MGAELLLHQGFRHARCSLELRGMIARPGAAFDATLGQVTY
jgi:hypothetical protein